MENKKRVLFVASVVKTHIMQFHLPCLKMFKDMGWETAVAARNDYEDPAQCNIPYCDVFYDIPFSRSPLSPKNAESYKMLKRVIDEGNFAIIHCHTPVGGVVGRLASQKARRLGARVIYTAHGFHFFKGGPLKNWIFYPVEKLLSYVTDTLITINREDYSRASRRFHAKEVLLVPGVGIATERFQGVDGGRAALRAAYGVGEQDTLLLSVGEVRDLKNHKTIIRAIHQMGNQNVHYWVAGRGEAEGDLRNLAQQLGLEARVHFLGYRKDVPQLLKACDIFCFPSYREGLPAALMEAMAAGVPAVASRVRGNTDLIQDGVNGFLCEPDDVDGFASKISVLMEDPDLARLFTRRSVEKIRHYDERCVLTQLQRIYGFNGQQANEAYSCCTERKVRSSA